MTDYETELTALNAVIAENEAHEEPSARWRAADALYKKAELVEGHEGPAEAVRFYAQAAERVAGVPDDPARELRVYALNDVVQLQYDLGHASESRRVAEALVSEHFDDPPAEAVDAVVAATLRLAGLRHEAGEHAEALELLERLIERYGQPGTPDYRLTAAAADSTAAWVLGSSGRREEGIRRYGTVIDALRERDDPDSRRILARAMGRQAQLMYDSNRRQEADARCREVVARFRGDEEPDIVEQVAWAQEMLDYSDPSKRRWFGLRR